jgi:hypothetical protein
MESEIRSNKKVLIREASRGLQEAIMMWDDFWLLVEREKQLVEIIPDARLRWVSEVVAPSRNRWQSCWDRKS